MKADFFSLVNHYTVNDLISAGMPAQAAEWFDHPEMDPGQKWKAMEPYWPAVRFTGYGQALRRAVSDLYGVAEINASTVSQINAKMAAANRPGLYEDVLHRKAGIQYCVLDDFWHGDPVRPDPRFFVLARKLDWYVTPMRRRDIQRMEEITEIEIPSLAGLEKAMEKRFSQCREAGMVTVKTTIAYQRSLEFPKVDRSAAEADFSALMKDERTPPSGYRAFSQRPYPSLESHMFHHLCRITAAAKIPLQVHTGLQAGNGNEIRNSNPLHLTNLLLEFPPLLVDIFHVGFPFIEECAALVKQFANTTVDFCWAHVVSPSSARQALYEYLDLLPYNKIMGFGGDYRHPELTYAHAQMAREHISTVLSAKVSEGWCREDEALEIARALLNSNPARIFPAGQHKSLTY